MDTLLLPFSPRFIVLTICAIVTALLIAEVVFDPEWFDFLLIPIIIFGGLTALGIRDVMDGHLVLPFVLATFLGGFVSGFSGFAMGIVVSGIWLHIMAPIQTAALIAGYGLLTQGYGIAKLRHELSWQNVWPLTLGTAIGIPIGVLLLTHTNPTHLRFGIGVLLVAYATYSLVRPPLGPFKISAPADVAIGVCNGVLGGLTGLGGIISTISCRPATASCRSPTTWPGRCWPPRPGRCWH